MKNLFIFFKKEMKIGLLIVMFSFSFWLVNHLYPHFWETLENIMEDREIFESINWKAVR